MKRDYNQEGMEEATTSSWMERDRNELPGLVPTIAHNDGELFPGGSSQFYDPDAIDSIHAALVCLLHGQ